MNTKQEIKSTFMEQHPNADIIKYNVYKFMMEEIKRSSYVVFQSNWGFLNNDIPFTFIAKREKNNKFTVIYWLNDWGTFEIETEVTHRIAKRWKLRTKSDRENFPDWKRHNARSLIEKYGVMPLSKSMVTRQYVSLRQSDIKDVILEMMSHYLTTKDRNGYWEAKVAVIYKEDFQ